MSHGRYAFDSTIDPRGFVLVGSRTLRGKDFRCYQCKKELNPSTGSYYCPDRHEAWCEWCFLAPSFKHSHSFDRKGEHVDFKVDKYETVERNTDD